MRSCCCSCCYYCRFMHAGAQGGRRQQPLAPFHFDADFTYAHIHMYVYVCMHKCVHISYSFSPHGIKAKIQSLLSSFLFFFLCRCLMLFLLLLLFANSKNTTIYVSSSPAKAGGSSWVKRAKYKTKSSSSFVFRNAPLILRLFDSFQSCAFMFMLCATHALETSAEFKWGTPRYAAQQTHESPSQRFDRKSLVGFIIFSLLLLLLLSIINSCKYLRHLHTHKCVLVSTSAIAGGSRDRASMWVSPLGGCLIKTHTNFDPNPVTTTKTTKMFVSVFEQP